MNKAALLFLGCFISINLFGQFNHPFNIEVYKDKNCCQDSFTNIPGGLIFSYIDNCAATSGKFTLVKFDSTKYFRNGESIWYYDKFHKLIRAIIPFYLGTPYGYIKTFYSNGNIESEGECRTVRYFHAAESKTIFKIDKTDTVLINYANRTTYDSIRSISKYSFTNSISSETAYNEMGSGVLIMSFPYYQRQKTGRWKYYNDKGRLVREENYLLGKLIQ